MSQHENAHDRDRAERTTERPEDHPDHASDEAELQERDAGAHAEQATARANFAPGDLGDQ